MVKDMKKIKIILSVFIIALGFAFFGCKEQKKKVPVSNIVIEGISEMKVGDKQTLTVHVYPEDATDKSFTWECDSNLVNFNEGEVEALKAGKAYVYATSNNGATDSFEIVITEKKEEVKALDLVIEVASEVVVGKVVKASFILVPENSTDEVTFTSNNPEIASITNDGTIKGLKEGTCTFTAKAGDVTKEFSVVVTKDALTSAEVKEKLLNVYDLYSTCTVATAKLTTDNSGDVSTFSYKFDFYNNTVNKLEYIQEGNVKNSIYVRDGIIYMDINETKGKYQLESSEYKTIMNTYSFAKFFNDPLKYRSDNSFFENLSLISDSDDKDNGTFTFELNLKKYNGSVLNLVGKDSVLLVVTLDKGVITVIELKTTGVEGDKSIKVEFLGEVCDITYPSDLDTYEDMQ